MNANIQLARGADKKIGRMVVHGTTFLLGGRIVRTLVMLVGTSVLARLLTPAEFGTVAVASLILPLSVALLDGLIDVPTIRDDDLHREGLANLIWVGIALMAGLGLLIWVAAAWLEVQLNSPGLGKALQVLSFGLLPQPFLAASHAILRREYRFAMAGAFQVISAVTYVVPAVVFALFGYGVWSLIIAQLISMLLTAFFATIASRIPVLPPTTPQIRVAWRQGGLGVATKLPAWLSANIDTLFASVALGAVGAGIYSRAYNITTQVKEPFAVLDQTVRQAFVAQRSLDDADAARATLRGLRLVVLMASVAAAGVIVMREAFVATLLGSQWSEVELPLAILAASLPARVARLYLDGFTYARGSMRHMLMRNIAIVLLLALGLWYWAAGGVTAISLVVAAVHLSTLLFSGGAVDIAVTGTISKRLVALVRGYSLGGFLVICGELPAVMWPDSTELMDWGARAAICTVLCIAIGILLPDSDLPKSIAKRRRRFLPVQ